MSNEFDRGAMAGVMFAKASSEGMTRRDRDAVRADLQTRNEEYRKGFDSGVKRVLDMFKQLLKEKRAAEKGA